MPELPEVETTVRGLVPVLQGRRLVSVEARRADLRRAFPPDLRQRLTGATVTGLSRRAKYGLIATDRGDTLVFHLGMSGRWRIDPAELGAHDHFLLETDEGRRAVLNDPRRFGSLDLVATAELEALPAFAAMGPEPLGERVRLRLSARGAGRPLGADQGHASRPADRRRPRQHLRLRGAPHGADRAVAGGGPDFAAPAGAAGRGDQGGAPRRDRGGGLVASRLCPAVGRARLFLEAMAGLRPGRGGVPLRKHDPPAGRFGPLHLLLPPLPALLRLTFRPSLRRGAAERVRWIGRALFI